MRWIDEFNERHTPRRKRRRRKATPKRTGYPSFNAHNPDDPLPEPSMRWRRYLTIALVLLNSAMLAWIVYKLDEPSALRWVAIALVGLSSLMAIMYMGGASANDIARILSAGKMQASSMNVQTPFGHAQVGFQQDPAIGAGSPEEVGPCGPPEV